MFARKNYRGGAPAYTFWEGHVTATPRQNTGNQR